jgi:predicted anti-sigma-YlaC factor YlaD
MITMPHVTEEQLNLYLDQVLSSQECTAIEAHLAVCATCRAELESLQSLFVALNTLPADPLSDDLAAGVLSAVAGERQRAAQRRRGVWGVLGLQGIAIILLLVFGWTNLATQIRQLNHLLPDWSPALVWAEVIEKTRLVWASSLISGQAWIVKTSIHIQTFPTIFSQYIRDWPEFSGVGGTTAQIAFIGLAAGLMWLIGNYIFLRSGTHHSNTRRHSHH